LHGRPVVRVCDILQSQTDEVVEEWAAEVLRDVDSASNPSPLALIDHGPQLLDDLGEWLRHDGKEGTLGYWDHAHRRALDRLGKDFDLREVVREYAVLRDILLKRIQRQQAQLDSLNEVRRMDEALDMAIAEAVDRFSRAHEGSS
jgi:hypothetical protein